MYLLVENGFCFWLIVCITIYIICPFLPRNTKWEYVLVTFEIKKIYNSVFSLFPFTAIIQMASSHSELCTLTVESLYLARSNSLYALKCPLRFYRFYFFFFRRFLFLRSLEYCGVRYADCSSSVRNLYFRLDVEFWIASLLCYGCISSVSFATLWPCSISAFVFPPVLLFKLVFFWHCHFTAFVG